MAFWRLFGTLPQAKTREELWAQSLHGWNPWRFAPSPSEQSAIVVPDPEDARSYHHIQVSVSGPPGSEVMYAAVQLGINWWFYVPAAPDNEGAFVVKTPRYEGFWRAYPDEESNLPWPIPGTLWSNRSVFVAALDTVEAKAQRTAYRGYAKCRLCGCRNGHELLRVREWEWPAGFRHYVDLHLVRPTAEFEEFIIAAVTDNGILSD